MIAKEVVNRCDDALNEYVSTSITLRELSVKYKIARSFISGYLLAKGIDIYSRKSHVNDRIFESIDTEEKAYWLGFLYADGCVHKFKNSYKIELTLQESDLEHLLKFKDFIDWKESPKHRDAQKAYRISFGSRKVAEDLINLGCIPNKSLVLTFPDKVPDSLIRHFIRGYFDGDGSIHLVENKHSITPDIRILGTKEFLEVLLTKFQTNPPVIKKCKHNESNNYYIKFNKEDSYKFLHYIYEDACIYLQRKYDKYVLAVSQSNL